MKLSASQPSLKIRRRRRMMKRSKKASNSNKDQISELNMELNSSNSAGNVVGSSSRTDTYENTNTEGKTFSCKFCKREFSSAQALGGHQNAHKQERALKKLCQGHNAGFLGSPYFPCYPYPTYTTHSLYGRSSNGALDSMIGKPDVWSNGFRYSHPWSRQDQGMLNSSPFDAFGIMRSNTTPSSRPKDGNASAETLSLFPDTATNSSSQVINKVESSNIDLSLKL